MLVSWGKELLWQCITIIHALQLDAFFLEKQNLNAYYLKHKLVEKVLKTLNSFTSNLKGEKNHQERRKKLDTRKVNKKIYQERGLRQHFNTLPLENLNECSLRANYKMLTLKCWVAEGIMGYCTVKMPDSCMLSYCVI